ncbi:hypothetical protein IC608_04585 [Devosia sp. PTR5]|uniref:Uncharacterized protein n=1 Tax=Devosia oryzisoli TaxID=2774138 RepID=A0A927FR76_9HYPH|nr:hypothetical protein [Devosia oryzisoli]MBD8064750.1 hypothetical protein [Devosia oryzisoli]
MPEPRKLESGVFVFTMLGALLLVPPLVIIFNQPIVHFGVPQVVLYLFGVWLALIVGTALLTRFLPRDARGDSEDRR